MSIISTGLLISFILAFWLGIRKNRFAFVLISMAIGAGIGFLSTYLYFLITPPRDIGFGIIALLPAAFLIFPFLNALCAFIGGLIGLTVRKSFRK